MSATGSESLRALYTLAESFAGRPLTDVEQAVLEGWAHDNLGAPPPSGGEPASGQPAVEHAKASVGQAENAIRRGQAQTASAIASTLQSIRHAADQASQAVQSEEQAILKVIQRAQSLAALRESNSAAGADAISPGSHIVLHQIGNRLEHLITQQVGDTVSQRLGAVEARISQRVAQTDQRLTQLEQRLIQLEQGLTATSPAAPTKSGKLEDTPSE